MSTRRLAAGAMLVAAVALAGCSSTRTATNSRPVDPMIVAMYSAVEDNGVVVPAVPVQRIEPEFFRQQVPTPEYITAKPGTIVVDPQRKFLYFVEPGGTSMRYGIGVGRQGFAWKGEATIKDKQEWPKWFPPPEMQARDRFAAQYANGMDGGLSNPLGARALYLWQGDKDTLYRLHGTNEPMSIGRAVSSGCIRLLNQDIMDLYNRVPAGTKVIVLGGPESIDPSAIAGAPPPAAVAGQYPAAFAASGRS